MTFAERKIQFDELYRGKEFLERSLVPVDDKFISNISIKDVNKQPNEEYYKWQFIYSLIAAGLVPRDNIGTEIYFPKGNRNAAPIKIDAVIFSSPDWFDIYRNYREHNNQDSLVWLRQQAIAVIEFKRSDKKIEQVFNSQIRAAINEPDRNFVLGIYYDAGRLFLFKRVAGDITRFDNGKNFPTSQRLQERLQLEITDPYYLIPGLTELLKLEGRKLEFDTAQKIEDLDIIQTITDENVKSSLNRILRRLDSVSLFNEEGYLILIQLLALKIYDEKQSELHGSPLRFFVRNEEVVADSLNNENVQIFLSRLQDIYNEAKRYYKILSETKIQWTNIRHVRVVTEVVEQFQRYSFVRSRKSDLYQLVFYNFATKFKKDENAQFLTPLPIIDFMVSIINPRRNETVCDPCCGIGDFLSMSYVNSSAKLDDRNLYGFDSDHNMTLLAQLNMLLNGDGNAVITYVPDKGSITQKLAIDGEIKTLDHRLHKAGNWDNWPDNTELLKYDVILTNPPFGKGRNLDLAKSSERQAAEFYELYELYVKENPKAGLDLGIVFLENAVRMIKEGGRFGIVLSNSIASNNTWLFARDWLLRNVRVVALIDMPPNVFAETGVNTTLVFGYKPSKQRLKQLLASDYAVFTREINAVGYIKRTSNRNVIFEPDYLLDPVTFETVIGKNGESRVNEDFSDTVSEFREWCLFQEREVKKLFID